MSSNTQTKSKSTGAAAGKTLKLRYHKSFIGYAKDQRETVKALGFHRLGQVVEKPDNPSVRGMVHKVRHLVEVEGEGEILGSTIHPQG
jgi:large subunit ribosomal protein L30